MCVAESCVLCVLRQIFGWHKLLKCPRARRMDPRGFLWRNLTTWSPNGSWQNRRPANGLTPDHTSSLPYRNLDPHHMCTKPPKHPLLPGELHLGGLIHPLRSQPIVQLHDHHNAPYELMTDRETNFSNVITPTHASATASIGRVFSGSFLPGDYETQGVLKRTLFNIFRCPPMP